MYTSDEIQLSNLILDAVRKTLDKLFTEFDENFYYCSLITSGEAHPPSFVAWSTEALLREASRSEEPQRVESLIKWSYADSPYFLFEDMEFEEVKAAFYQRADIDDDLTDDEWDSEYQTRINAMTLAMKKADEEGLFSINGPRENIVINVEVMPPDETNTERALYLNPSNSKLLKEWLNESP